MFWVTYNALSISRAASHRIGPSQQLLDPWEVNLLVVGRNIQSKPSLLLGNYTRFEEQKTKKIRSRIRNMISFSYQKIGEGKTQEVSRNQKPPTLLKDQVILPTERMVHKTCQMITHLSIYTKAVKQRERERERERERWKSRPQGACRGDGIGTQLEEREAHRTVELLPLRFGRWTYPAGNRQWPWSRMPVLQEVILPLRTPSSDLPNPASSSSSSL